MNIYQAVLILLALFFIRFVLPGLLTYYISHLFNVWHEYRSHWHNFTMKS